MKPDDPITCLKEFVGHNLHRIASRRKMYEVSNTHQSYSSSYQKESRYEHNSHIQSNGSYEYNTHMQNNAGFYVNPDTTIGSLRSHDDELAGRNVDEYEFGSPPTKGDMSPSCLHCNQCLQNGNVVMENSPQYFLQDSNSHTVSTARDASKDSSSLYYEKSHSANTSYNSHYEGQMHNDSFGAVQSEDILVNPPNSASTPEPPTEAVVVEERQNDDGTTVLMQRTVTAKSSSNHYDHNSQNVEIHISPATETIVPHPSPSIDDFNMDLQKMYASSSIVDDDDKEEYLFVDEASQRGANDAANTLDAYHYNNTVNINSMNSYNADTRITNINQYNMNYTENPMLRDEFETRRDYNENIDINRRDYNENIDMNRSICSLPSKKMSDGYSPRKYSLPPKYMVDGGSPRNNTLPPKYMNQPPRKQSLPPRQPPRKQSLPPNNQTDGAPPRNMGEPPTTITTTTIKTTTTQELNLTILKTLLQTTTETKVQSNTAGYLMHLAYKDDNVKKSVNELDMITLLVQLLYHEDEDCHRNAAGALKNLSQGRYGNDNKMAIYNAGGVKACSQLLYKTSWIEVREHVTGVLYNLSSVKAIKKEIVKECLEAISILIIVPLSGYEKHNAELGRKPAPVSYSTLLRNSTGVLRNLSSEDVKTRKKIRSIEELIDSLIWIVRAAILSENKDDINDKVIENILGCLRNISYNLEEETEEYNYLDALKIKSNNDKFSSIGKDRSNSISNERHNSTNSKKANSHEDIKNSKDSSKDNVSQSQSQSQSSDKFEEDEKPTGCMKMKKRSSSCNNKRKQLRNSLSTSTSTLCKKPPNEQFKYLKPERDGSSLPYGIELLWQPETVTHYIYLITKSSNTMTLEACVASIHNLIACKWNWSSLLRIHVRLHKGIPPMQDLLSVDQEYVVRSVAHTFRNLAFDSTNKWSIGKFAHKSLLKVLPDANCKQSNEKPCESTICSILQVLQAIVYEDYINSKYVKEANGIPKLLSLTRGRHEEGTGQLRTYTEQVVTETDKVLLQMWQFKDIRETINEDCWSPSTAESRLKKYKNRSEKEKDADKYASLEDADDDDESSLHRSDKDFNDPDIMPNGFDTGDLFVNNNEDLELHEIPNTKANNEEDIPLLKKNLQPQKKNKNDKRTNNKDEDKIRNKNKKKMQEDTYV